MSGEQPDRRRSSDSAFEQINSLLQRMEDKIDSRFERLEQKLDDRAEWEKQMELRVAALEVAYRIIAFIGGALGLSVLALIWALITGQAHLTFSP